MGCPNLAAANVPFWPTSDTDEDWPLTNDKKHRLTHFQFDRPASAPDNTAALERVLEFINQNGVKYHAAAAPALRLISQKDLRDRVNLKFRDLQKALRGAGRLSKKGGVIAVQGDGDQEDDGEERPRPPVLSKSQWQSHAKGVSPLGSMITVSLFAHSQYRNWTYD